MFKRQRRPRSGSCCFTNWHFANVYSVPLLAGWGFFVSVPARCRFCERSVLVFVPTPIVMAYYLNPVRSRQVPQLHFLSQYPNFVVFLLFMFFQRLLVGSLDLVRILQLLKILRVGEYFSFYPKVFTIWRCLSDFSKSCPVV